MAGHRHRPKTLQEKRCARDLAHRNAARTRCAHSHCACESRHRLARRRDLPSARALQKAAAPSRAAQAFLRACFEAYRRSDSAGHPSCRLTSKDALALSRQHAEGHRGCMSHHSNRFARRGRSRIQVAQIRALRRAAGRAPCPPPEQQSRNRAAQGATYRSRWQSQGSNGRQRKRLFIHE